MTKELLYEKKIPELCVPAGNLKVLNYAIAYGADAVYVGGDKYNLRTLGDNFSLAELKTGAETAHNKNKKIYLALNAIMDESEIRPLMDYLDELKKIDFDALIISDPGLISNIKEIMPDTKIHLSTQVSTSNHLAVNFWVENGVSRVNLAREISYEDLKIICSQSKAETEVFVHGALCISYSGRCLLSRYLAERDANKGFCAHACRWKYYLMEEKRPNLFLQVLQDKRGTYIMNSRDLCLIGKLDSIVEAGVSGLKIEGRMKTESYVSTVTWVYRNALDLIKEGKLTDGKKAYFKKELNKTSHRTFTEGFMFKNTGDGSVTMENDNSGYIQKYRFIGDVKGYDRNYDGPVITARNQIKTGSTIDILQPGRVPKKFKLGKIIDAVSGNAINVANTNDTVIIPGPGKIDDFGIIKIRL
jgi:U32 family peptidase